MVKSSLAFKKLNMKSNIEVEEYTHSREKCYKIKVTDTLNSKDLNEIENAITTKNVRYISFDYEQNKSTWEEINRLIKKYDSTIRITLNYYETKLENLDFLKYLVDLEELYIFYFRGKDLSPIAYLKKLRILKFFSAFKSEQVRLKPLTKLESLEELKIFHIKDIEEVGCFISLKLIELESLKTNNLDFLKPLQKLEEIILRSSEKVIDFSALYNLPKLKKAFFAKNYKNIDAEFISHLQNLEKLDITDFNSVKKFPSLEKLSKLKELSIINWKVLSDIKGISKAPNLEKVSLFAGKEFKPSALEVLKENKKLIEIRVGFNTKKENIEGEIIIKDILGKNRK